MASNDSSLSVTKYNCYLAQWDFLGDRLELSKEYKMQKKKKAKG